MFARALHALALGLALLLAARTTYARIEAEALVGRPFGVGRITISGSEAAIDLNRVLISDGGERVFYPAVGTGVVGRLIGQILGDPADRPTTGASVHFLFRGEEPNDVTVYTPQAVKVTVQPARGNQRQMDRLFTGWWREYSTAARQVRKVQQVMQVRLVHKVRQVQQARKDLQVHYRQVARQVILLTGTAVHGY